MACASGCSDSGDSGGAAASDHAAVAARSVVLIAYEALVDSLEPLRLRAFEDSAVALRWDEIQRSMEQYLSENNPQMRAFIERKYAIEDRFRRAQQGQEVLPDSEAAALFEDWQAIQWRLLQENNQLLAQREFALRVAAFQAGLYQRMRELEPARAAEIDSLEALVKVMEAAYNEMLGPMTVPTR